MCGKTFGKTAGASEQIHNLETTSHSSELPSPDGIPGLAGVSSGKVMVDVVDSVTRSRMMAGIRSKHTRPERELRKALHALGFRFRIHVKGLAGTPDIVLPRWKAAIFVQGCFWHRHAQCRFASMPSTRPEFWRAKFDANVSRDDRNQSALLSSGWRVAVVWECMIREAGADVAASVLSKWLKYGEKSRSILPEDKIF